MGNPRHLYFLMNHLFLGFFLAVLYGVISSVVVWQIDGVASSVSYLRAFFQNYQYAIIGGLIVSTFILVNRTQSWIPSIIEENFTNEELSETTYSLQKKKYLSVARSISFSTTFITVGFCLFYVSGFPHTGAANISLMVFACTLYGLGVYIGRKFFYIAQMLNSIEDVPVNKDIFTDDKLGTISTYVNSLSTLTVIFVFGHVYVHYHAPFEYNTVVGDIPRMFMLLPAVLAIPIVSIFNFYPRTVLRRLYSKSIKWKTDKIKRDFLGGKTTEYERLSYMIEYDKMSKDELKYRLRVTLSDLPIAITIILMVVSLMF